MTPSIIAIDPGYDRCGVALLSEEKGVSSVMYASCITTKKTEPQEKRLAFIYRELEALILKYAPTHLALETLFFSVNKKQR